MNKALEETFLQRREQNKHIKRCSMSQIIQKNAHQNHEETLMHHPWTGYHQKENNEIESNKLARTCRNRL